MLSFAFGKTDDFAIFGTFSLFFRKTFCMSELPHGGAIPKGQRKVGRFRCLTNKGAGQFRHPRIKGIRGCGAENEKRTLSLKILPFKIPPIIIAPKALPHS